MEFFSRANTYITISYPGTRNNIFINILEQKPLNDYIT